MALKTNFKYEFPVVVHLPWGFEQLDPKVYMLNDAHIKVQMVEGSKDAVSATVSITSGEKQVHKTYGFMPDLNGDNFIAQAYAHLKTLPEFADAVDC